MELTKECLEEIVLAAREAGTGKLVITVKTRPEDQRAFDINCAYEKTFRVGRTGGAAVPTQETGRKSPADKY
jgi:hypothetical protein